MPGGAKTTHFDYIDWTPRYDTRAVVRRAELPATAYRTGRLQARLTPICWGSSFRSPLPA